MRYSRAIGRFGKLICPLRALAAAIAVTLFPGHLLLAQKPAYLVPAPSAAPGRAPNTVPPKGGAPVDGAPSPFGEQLTATPGISLGEAAPAQTGSEYAVSAPGFIGDFFGGAAGGGGSQILDTIIVGSVNMTGQVPLLGVAAPYSLTNPPGGPGGRGEFDPQTNAFTQLNNLPATFTTAISANDFRVLLNFNTANNLPTPAPQIVDNSGYRALADGLLTARNGVGGTTTFNSQQSVIEGVVNNAVPGQVNDNDTLTVAARYAYDYVVALNVPSPGTGGLVGVQKLIENGSPIPRDRLLFNYSMFNNVRFTPGGIDVNRFVVGFEKTFLDQSTSFELRVPFASTLSSDQVSGQAAAMNTEFGNLTMYGKALMAYGQTYAVGAGLGVAIPTADNINVRDFNGTQLVQIKNQAVQLLPYLGGIYAPNEQFYSQAILQVDVVTSGNSTFVNNGVGLTKVGALNDPTWLFASLNLGYWTYRTAASERLSGVSPLVELHYNKSLNASDAVTAGAFRIGNGASNIEMINAVAGVNLEFYGRNYVSVAYVAPLTNGNDRFFDGELRILCNRYWW